MKNRTFIVSITVLIAALVFLLLGEADHKGIDKEFPCVEIGKSINFKDVVRVDDEYRLTNLNKIEATLSAVYILKPSCFHCEENLIFWAKLKRIFKNQLHVSGIILSDVSTVDATQFLKSKKLNFPLFTPKDKDRFMFEFNVKFNLSQTVLIDKGVVVYSKAGVLEVNDFFKIKNLIKEIIQNET